MGQVVYADIYSKDANYAFHSNRINVYSDFIIMHELVDVHVADGPNAVANAMDGQTVR